jgi:hypothetical protein
MRVRITKPLAGTVDGIQLSRLLAGQVYDVNSSLACYLLSEGVAEPANHEHWQVPSPAERKPLERPVETRSRRVTLPRSMAAERAHKPRRKRKH